MKSTLGLLCGLLLSGLLVALMGESPVLVFKVLFLSSTATKYDLGLTLFYMTPLLLTGLAVALPYRAGIFNIGGEGQMLVGCMAAAVCGILLPQLPSPFSWIFAALVAAAAGAFWAWISAYLKVKRDAHEVVITIMLNFIAAALTSYFAVNVFPNPNSQNPETLKIGASYQFATWDPLTSYFDGSPINITFVVAILLCYTLHLFIEKSAIGFRIRASGMNSDAAKRSGISVDRAQIAAFCLGGACAGLVAMNEVLGSAGQYKLGFSPDYGFMGIAVALLARKRIWSCIPSALLFAVLHKGAMDLDIETESITRDFSKVIQGCVLLSVIAFDGQIMHGLRQYWTKMRQARKGSAA